MMQQDSRRAPGWQRIKGDGVETNGTVDVEECYNIVTTLS
jgi:hypothetical protein